MREESPPHIRAASTDAGVLRFITAGSVDDGKSTLIGRLLHDTRTIFADQLAALQRASQRCGLDEIDLSLLTDGLEAEREQGITIDVAYRYFATPRRKFIIGDAPGHVQYTRNMVTAASTADVAVLLIDARKGVLAQTRRHAYLARWLGITRIVLAVNKMDLADYARAPFEAHRDAFLAFAVPLGFEEVLALPMSARAGDMVVARRERLDWYTGPTLIDYLDRAPARARRLDAEFRFPVQRVARASLATLAVGSIAARGYQGTVAAGHVRVGDTVAVLPAGTITTVVAIIDADGLREQAHADQAVTIYLADELDLGRGDLIAAAAAPARVLKRLPVELCWLSGHPWEANRAYLLKHTTRTVRIASLDPTRRIDVETFARADAPGTLRVNDLARAELTLQQPICADAYAANRATGSFILIDAHTHDTVAAGVILDPASAGA